MAEDSTTKSGAFLTQGWAAEALTVWRALPNRWLVVGLMASWVALFHFLGNSTLGYVNTRSLFGWWVWVYTRGAQRPDGSIEFGKIFSGDEAYAWFIPLIVLGLLWWRRQDLVALPKQICWPALGILLVGALLQVLGYMVQQARLSVIAFAIGIYGITGLFWGWRWLRFSFFPFSLLLFTVPIGTAGEAVTFPLRLLATQITEAVCHTALGIDVIRRGTLLFDSGRAYQYEVAAACSGIRSLTAILAFGMIYGYLSFNSTWRRLVLIAAAVPLAVIANVFRLTTIILAAEAFGQQAGNLVHENSWFSLTPYIPAIGGMLLLGWWLSEERRSRVNARGSKPPSGPLLPAGAEQQS